MVVAGEQGSAKSTFVRLMRDLVDPNTVSARALLRDDRDLFIAATNSYVLAFDNVSGLPAWLSDTFCRIATGGGFRPGQLYTDQEEVLFSAERPIALNGIEDVVTRPDLADRALMLTLQPIPEEQRRPERELLAEFELARGGILGALLDGLVHGFRKMPLTRLDELPRMADFALWASACETAFWPAGSFMAAYSRNLAESVETVLAGDPVADTVRTLMSGRAEWVGTAAELLKALERLASERVTRAKTWPGGAQALSNRLRRAATFLRRVGIEVGAEPRTKSARRIRITCIDGVSSNESRPNGNAEPQQAEPPHPERSQRPRGASARRAAGQQG